MNPLPVTASRSCCRSARSGISAESREGKPVNSSQEYPKQIWGGPVGVDESRIGIGVMRDEHERRVVVEPCRALLRGDQGASDRARITVGDQVEEIGIAAEVPRFGLRLLVQMKHSPVFHCGARP
jgi:hypothetical protein